MAKQDARAVGLPTIQRLPLYLRILREVREEGLQSISTTRLSEELQVQPIMVRKDLSVTGVIGRPRIGYQVGELIDHIERFIGWRDTSSAFLVGVGHLGTALLGYRGFEENGIHIVAAFDTDKRKIGTSVHARTVFPVDKLGDLAPRMRVRIGILTVPAACAQETATTMVEAGICAIWNFTPICLDLPPHVIHHQENLASSLAVLSTRLRMQLEHAQA